MFVDIQGQSNHNQ